MMTARDRRRVAIYEYLFCFTIPIFIMATQILYQPVRYGIFRAAGCTMAIVLTWPTYVCFLMWAPMLSSIGCLLSRAFLCHLIHRIEAEIQPVYVLYRLFCHRRDFRRLVNNASSALTTSRFIRLALLAICSFGFNLPLSIHAFVEAQKVPTGYVEYDWKFIHEYVRNPVLHLISEYGTERVSSLTRYSIILSTNGRPLATGAPSSPAY